MYFHFDPVIAGLVLLVVGPIAYRAWLSEKKSIGTIQCRRCGYIGQAKGLFVPFIGVRPVCGKCQSEDWQTVLSHSPVEPTQTPEQKAALREAERLEREKEAAQAALKAARIAARNRIYRAKGIEPGPWAWFKALPDVTQAILLGLALAIPAALIVGILLFASVSIKPLPKTEGTDSSFVTSEKLNIKPAGKAPNERQNENAFTSSRKQSHSESAESLNVLGVKLLNNHDFDAARVVFSNALKLDPNSTKAYKNRAICFGQLGDREKELSDLCQAIQRNPKDADAYLRRAAYYFLLGAIDKAIADCTDSIRIDAKCFGAYLIRGNANFQIGEFKNAVSDLTVVVGSNPQDVPPLVLRSVAYKEMNDYTHAITDASTVINIDPKNVQVLSMRCLWYSHLKNYQLVINDASAIISLDPKNDNAFLLRGLAHKALGNESEAVSDLVEAVKLNPKNRENIGIKYDVKVYVYQDKILRVKLGQKFKFGQALENTNPKAAISYYKEVLDLAKSLSPEPAEVKKATLRIKVLQTTE